MSMIQSVLLIPVCLSLFVSAVYSQENNPATQVQSPSWQRYTVSGEEFSIELPTHPAMTTHIESEWGNRKKRTKRQLGAYVDGVVYAIFSVDDKDVQEFIRGITSSPRWDPLSEQKVSVDGFTGRQYFSTDSLGGTVQIFATRNHVYHFQAFGAKADDPRVKRFFSSLILGREVTGIKVSDGQGILFKPANANIGAPEDVLSGRQTTRKMILIMKPEPSYTDEARKNEITGTVVLKTVFSSDGSVGNIRIVSGLPYGLTETAIDAARKIKYIPATKDGKFVSMWIQLEYKFNLY